MMGEVKKAWTTILKLELCLAPNVIGNFDGCTQSKAVISSSKILKASEATLGGVTFTIWTIPTQQYGAFPHTYGEDL